MNSATLETRAEAAHSPVSHLDKVLAEAKEALEKTFSVRGLSDQQRLQKAKELNQMIQKIEFEHQRSTLVSYPTNVELPVAGKCNLRCTMCSLSLGAPSYPHWTVEEVKAFEPYFRYARNANPTGVGEPLSNKDFFKILELFQRHHLLVGFYTNATLLTPEKIDRLIDHQVTQVNVSIDGASAATFDKIRRGAKFDQVVGNVRALVKRREERKARFPRLQLAMVLMLDNMHEAPEFIRLAAKLGADSVYLMYMSGTIPEQRVQLDPERCNQYMAEARSLAQALGISVMAPAPIPSESKQEAVQASSTSPSDTPASACRCAYPWASLMIHNDGGAGPCCKIKGDLDGHKFGNIHHDRPETFWNSPGMVHLRNRLASGDAPDVCRRCDIRTLNVG